MATSYNGWPASPNPSDIGVVQSEWFPGGVKSGDVTTVFRYLVEQFDARVEKLVDGWCWGYNYRANANDPSSLSCHSSGTALDLNAPEHPNGAYGTFTDEQVTEIYRILDECQGAIHWLNGDDGGTADQMHFEVCVDAATLARVAAELPGHRPPPDDEPEGMPTMYVVISGIGCYAIINNVMFRFRDWNTYIASYNASSNVPQVVISDTEAVESRQWLADALFKQSIIGVTNSELPA